jgi:hypothetical protein
MGEHSGAGGEWQGVRPCELIKATDAGKAREREVVNDACLDGPVLTHHFPACCLEALMLRCVVFIGSLLSLAVLLSGQADTSRQINPIPFSHVPCSVLDGRPCTPSHCSLLDHGPCIPEIDYPYGQDLRLTVQSVPPEQDAAKYRRPDHDLGTIADLFAALRACWSPPIPPAAGATTVQVCSTVYRGGYGAIPRLIEDVMGQVARAEVNELQDVLEADAAARRVAQEWIAG